MKIASWRVLICLIVLILGIVYAAPSIPGFEKTPFAKFFPDARINLGLDLKGGVSLTLGVQAEKAMESLLSSAGQELRDEAKNKNIPILSSRVIGGNTLNIVLSNQDNVSAFENLLSVYFPTLHIISSERGSNNEVTYHLQFTATHWAKLESEIVDQAERTIRNRIDQFGVAEPDIRKQADNRIQIQLPGLDDPQRAIQLIGQTASLSFHLVRDDIDPRSLMLPVGTAFYPMILKRADGTEYESQIVLDTTPLMTGVDISDARPSYDEKNQSVVSLTFNNKGAQDFERVTGAHVKERMAIVLDGKVFSAPVIEARIAGGRASISGMKNVQEAQDLSIVLRAGALPAPVDILEERTVGPSLGQASIEAGLLAALVGGLLVILIIPIYYGLSGLIADVMLCFSMLLVTAGLAAFGATLTLPGIAGIVLTIGMAVDANVLIYERIREEIKQGLKPKDAVDLGFARATISIMDSNLTTIIAAAILYQFGTGPIRGFAITLTIGIIASMFTAVFVARCIFEWWMNKNQGKSISI